jgi:hypothetical protein
VKSAARTASIAILISALWAGCVHAAGGQRWPLSTGELFTNQSLIEDLYGAPLPRGGTAVFRTVFYSLPDEVTVYPSEGYYYFRLTRRGVTIDGNIALSADVRDEGVVHFEYHETFAVDDPNHWPIGQERDLTAKDHVFLKKLGELRYAITFEGKRVVFKLNDVGASPPKKGKLSRDETYVGTSFDESGLQFHLLFNRRCKAFTWILNEDRFVPERFMQLKPHLIVGVRTEFAFYDDAARNRKTLIAVRRQNVERNSWFDGPFDQLPDNQIKAGTVRLREYIEAAYPDTKGKIDEYGILIKDRSARVAITPYAEYSSDRELVELVGAQQPSVGGLCPSRHR